MRSDFMKGSQYWRKDKKDVWYHIKKWSCGTFGRYGLGLENCDWSRVLSWRLKDS